MNNEIIHNRLNDIYDQANSIYEHFKQKYPHASINSYKGHYIKFNNKYMYQKYYMPVISNGEKGDICFNLDGTSFEFFLTNNEFKKVKLEELFNLPYSIEIYDGNNSEFDIYYEKIEELYEKVSNIDKIGITINCQSIEINQLIDLFNKVYNIIYIT